jgi:hypothetical protein
VKAEQDRDILKEMSAEWRKGKRKETVTFMRQAGQETEHAQPISK